MEGGALRRAAGSGVADASVSARRQYVGGGVPRWRRTFQGLAPASRRLRPEIQTPSPRVEVPLTRGSGYNICCRSAALGAAEDALASSDAEAPITIAAIVGDGPSHFLYPHALNRVPPTWMEVAEHLSTLLSFRSSRYDLRPILEEHVKVGASGTAASALAEADVVLAVGCTEVNEVRGLHSRVGKHGSSFVSLGPGAQGSDFSLRRRGVVDAVKGLPAALSGRAVAALASDVDLLWNRRNSVDLVFLVLLVVDKCVREVPELGAMGKAGGLQLLWCMFSNCRQEVLDCVRDPDCRAALDCLQECGLNDQVRSYQCICTHESPLFEKFSLCVLQKNNCMQTFATAPSLPLVEPLGSFRGEPLTHESAEAILIGWLGDEPYSWKVVCGQNAAYDFFPNQHQIFYKSKSGRQMWYDPVFQVETLDGKTVWRRRHYRVKKASQAGTFFFSVLDNGVTSNEFWRIIDVAEDMSWAVLYYTGAASAAGQAYSGAVFVSRDGNWPSNADHFSRIERAHDRCGIKMWELQSVTNSDCKDAPLERIA